jgi:hypothetical protein
MSGSINDGGQAFPLAGSSDYSYEPQDGMSLRDYFAAKALQAMISMPITHTRIADGTFTAMETAGCCYQWADAMLAARATGKGGE